MGLITSPMICSTVLKPTATTSFISERYAASVVYGPLSMPWFADYMHLVFWFFFLTAIIISIWLVQMFYLLVRGGEGRLPVRETRGFSRAQTGDAITAVIPMCWSITMLMHASSHSSNFDENTDSTSLTVSIMAYQWGWNYYFPQDSIVSLGHLGGAEAVPATNSYSIKTDHVVLNPTMRFVNKGEWFGAVKQNGVAIHAPQIVSTDGVLSLAASLPTKIVGAISAEVGYSTTDQRVLASISEVEFFFGCIDRSTRGSLVLQTVRDGLALKRQTALVDDLDLAVEEFSSASISTQTTRQPTRVEYRTSFVGGMVSRMRLTSGVRLPSDTPLHVICGSRDVIHSWAVPGLSVKIDCIPGYNCHRRLILRWRGLFWGQCMEVCGRYHHWMPLLLCVVQFDVFIMWLKSISNMG